MKEPFATTSCSGQYCPKARKPSRRYRRIRNPEIVGSIVSTERELKEKEKILENEYGITMTYRRERRGGEDV